MTDTADQLEAGQPATSQAAPGQPGPGRATADAAFNAETKRIAERNDEVQRVARKLRTARETRELEERRRRDR